MVVNKPLRWLLLASLLIWSLLYPQRFLALWLTPDQQGRILFDLGYYTQAATVFQSPLWKGLSLYAAEDFDNAAGLFSQYDDENGLLAQGNAWAHSRNYLPAMRIYRILLEKYPDNTAVKNNMAIVQALIDANQMLSESQVPDGPETPPGDIGDNPGPESSEGDKRETFDLSPQEILTADQLLQDPALTEMWMRQVQKDPTQFLKIKFYMQLEQRKNTAAEAAGEAQP
ncbi:tetratricopeptide repeat protein [Oceanicoccus sagamiensis]|uniref:Uncharacterized protein n=1 Tax=Oceanicoccus sagamiensis TaxID=716816 RepID=A0A1X9NJX7_9GAMM|nr:hypothetical protein [Oceanicoccus sagamiensis]ARN75759.1 hypothetical protein BST96_17585 [Oceanicoccus sagamiensis]